MDPAARPDPSQHGEAMRPLDRLGRRLHDLRISVTDRCNFRCVYCMPAEVYGRDFPFLPRDQVLSFEEITRIAGLFTELGVDLDTAKKFGPIVIDYVAHHGGEDLVDKIRSALKI